jgi:four helix bundle protein
MRDLRRLEVWRKSRRLVQEVYRLTASYPPSERFGFVAQSRRAAISVAANIAEGAGRGSDTDFARFLDIAAGSLSELESHIVLAGDVDLTASTVTSHLTREISEIRRMLHALQAALRSGSYSSSETDRSSG